MRFNDVGREVPEEIARRNSNLQLRQTEALERIAAALERAYPYLAVSLKGQCPIVERSGG